MSGELDPKIRIRAPLRCDGIGSLDCAEDVDSGMRMAIRWLPLDANGDAAAKAMQQLPAHPTLPTIRRTGHVGAAAYVAMDFPDGKLLSTQLDQRMPVGELCRMGAEIADALATIHLQGVFHGEMSADSLLLLPGHKAILWDMPLVIANRLTDRRGEERAMASTVRMAPFLAPERAQGQPPSAAGDVYALGAVLCNASGGRAPSGASTLAIIYQIASGRWAPELPDGYPERLRALLARMVCRDPQARPTAREVADALARPVAIPALPTLSRRVTPPGREVATPKPALAEAPRPPLPPAPQVVAPAPVSVPATAISAPVRVTPALMVELPSVMVAPELAAQMEPEPAAELEAQAVRRSLRVPLALGIGLTLVLAAPVGYLALSSSPRAVPPVASPAPSALVAGPVAVTQQLVPAPITDSAEEVLAPLPLKQQSKAKAKVRAKGKVKAKARPKKMVASPAAAAAPRAEDFSFLEEVQTREEELKRPSL